MSSITFVRSSQVILWMITIFNLPCNAIFVSDMCIVLVSLCCHCKIFCPLFLSFFLPTFLGLWWVWMQHKVLHFPPLLQFSLFALFFFTIFLVKQAFVLGVHPLPRRRRERFLHSHDNFSSLPNFIEMCYRSRKRRSFDHPPSISCSSSCIASCSYSYFFQKFSGQCTNSISQVSHSFKQATFLEASSFMF